ncbi:hypothetical protein Bpfe_026505, partial [Biomphalaria pfeifferi]
IDYYNQCQLDQAVCKARHAFPVSLEWTAETCPDPELRSLAPARTEVIKTCLEGRTGRELPSLKSMEPHKKFQQCHVQLKLTIGSARR